MVEPISGWHDEHDNFARLLDMLELQISAYHRGEHPNYDLVVDILSYLRSYADRVHHPCEDVAFGRLLQRDPGMELVINRLLQEHRVIATAGSELLERVEEATGDVMVPREALEAAAATFLVYYRNHLANEERKVIPRAAQVLTPEDWAAVMAAVPTSGDPLFGRDVHEGFRQLRAQIERESKLQSLG